MSCDQSNSTNEQQRRVIKYFLDKLDNYAHKSHLWQLVHASHIRQNLLKKSRHISKIHSISEEFVRQCLSQLLTDVDQYVQQLYSILSTDRINDLIIVFKHSNQFQTAWRQIQLKQAKKLLLSLNNEENLNENQLFDIYINNIEEYLTPKQNPNNKIDSRSIRETPFDIEKVYFNAEQQAKQYLKTIIKRNNERCRPDIDLIDQIIRLGIDDMKKIPSREDFNQTNNFLGRVSVFHKVKESYKSILKNTGDDFMLIRFGRLIGKSSSKNTTTFNKQFVYLLHCFLKSIFTLFSLISIDSREHVADSISKLTSLFFIDDETTINKISFDLFSPENNVDRWTWIIEHWRQALRSMPLILTCSGSFTRLVRTTIGIGLIHIGQLAESIIENNISLINQEQIDEQLFQSLQIGFYFGIAYSVVDCLQDEIHNSNLNTLSKFFNENDSRSNPLETIDHWLLIVEELLSGKEKSEINLPKTPFTDMLVDSFEKLLILTNQSNIAEQCFNQLALLMRSQRLDKKDIQLEYNDENLYIGSILKSHFTFTCSIHLGQMSKEKIDVDRIWSMPFLGQLTDDCRDFNDDIRSSSVTPFTYYADKIKRKDRSVDQLINPFYMFLNLCSDIYLSSNRDPTTGSFLGRRIARSLYSIVLTKDESSFEYFLRTFSGDNRNLFDYFWNRLRKQFPLVTDPEKIFFRKIDLMASQFSKTNRKLETYVFENIHHLENSLYIHSVNNKIVNNRQEQILLSAMNYSVKAGGKRLRMLLMIMIADLYNIDMDKIVPLACGIEYLHTSSLIFDDLPAQDNSDLRRGRTTLHKIVLDNDVPISLCEGRAQLAAVDLIAVSMNIINNGLVRQGFSPDKIIQVFGEISQLMHSLCVGQMMDLFSARTDSSSNIKSVEDLDEIAHLKTGKTIEAVLIAPALLASSTSNDRTEEFHRLRELSRLMGILFQMKDDLLDVESTETIGKPQSLDIKNNTMTYVNLIGIEQTRQRLNQYLDKTLDLVDQSWPNNAETVKDVVKHIVSRKT